MKQKFYSLKPQFYLDLWDKPHTSPYSLSNKNLKIFEFEHKLKKALSGWHNQILFDADFLDNPHFNFFIKSVLESKIPALAGMEEEQKNQNNKAIKAIGQIRLDNKLEEQNQNRQSQQWKSREQINRQTEQKLEASRENQLQQKREQIRENNQLQKTAEQTRENNIYLKPVLQITGRQFNKHKKQILYLNQTFKNNLDFHFICEDDKQIPVKELESFNNSISYVWIVTKKTKLDIKNGNKNYLYFPYKKHLFDPFLTPRQAVKFIKKQPHIPVYPTEVYDSRIPQDMDLEPCILPFAQNSLLNKKIYFSVIIPSYNSKTELINSLKYLAQQDFPRNEYELIAVDDGSSDNTRSALADFVKQHPSLNIKALHFPRVIERKTGDSRFRAGLARNLGVKHSSGKLLAFLDSDILTPPDYLARLKKDHEKADLVLLKRYHLKPKAPIEDLFSAYKNLKGSYYIEDKRYWGAFYKKGFEQVKCPWKYVCTYGLSLSKKDFIESGAFGKNFIFYGFEDTDLGYRLFKQNKKFLLSGIEVYHQTAGDKAVGSWSYTLLRQKQLAKTAKIFFYRHLKPDIYKELNIYMRQERPLSYFLPFLY